jgi:hypothetical protein
MHKAKLPLFKVSLLILVWSGSAVTQELVTYSAEYQATASGLSATAQRSLQQDNESQYILENSMEVSIAGTRIGSVEESSRFNWINDKLQPNAYRYSQSGIASKQEQVRFDWENNIATSTEDDDSWEHPLFPSVVDKLSYQLLLRLELQRTDNTEIEFQVIDTDEVETHLYRVSGTELTETSLGLLNTLKIERVREGNSNRSTIFWLASDWDMLLVRFLQTDSAGSETELLLQQAVVAGQQLTALP